MISDQVILNWKAGRLDAPTYMYARRTNERTYTQMVG